MVFRLYESLNVGSNEIAGGNVCHIQCTDKDAILCVYNRVAAKYSFAWTLFGISDISHRVAYQPYAHFELHQVIHLFDSASNIGLSFQKLNGQHLYHLKVIIMFTLFVEIYQSQVEYLVNHHHQILSNHFQLVDMVNLEATVSELDHF